MTSIVATICQDMRDSRCSPILITDIGYALSGASRNRQTVCAMLIEGYTQREIASELHVSQPAVSYHAHALRHALASLLDASYT
jgi:DNA-binding NarL/FixJ family response regulator